ncbi:MAG: carbohydrate ABC transporter substrate-binding protein [Cyanobacteria bacterium SBLK]|nr:carbohydrate ABC transporter substrate-binding protein [Cyanobacteria bacterium SBLK]
MLKVGTIIKNCFLLLLFGSLLFLSGCTLQSNAVPPKPQGMLTLWSFFPNRDVDIVVRNYENAHPNTEIVHTGYEFLALHPALTERMAQGLGPDAAIITERELPKFIKAGLIENLDKYDIDLRELNDRPRISVYDSEGHLYGIPIAHQTMALCYNKTLVEQPAATLDEWLQQARNGTSIAIEPSFLNTMWGIGAYGGEFFDEENRFTLKTDDINLWLSWLKQARELPSVYLDPRRGVLFNLFATGEIAYFPCWTFEYIPLQEQMEDKLAVTVLPRSQRSPAKPQLETDVIVLNRHTTAAKKALALSFAKFLIQPTQQLALISGKEHTITPVHPQTRVDDRLLPRISVFKESADRAVAFPMSDLYNTDRLRYYGDIAYTRVLQGQLLPRVGAQNILKFVKNPPPDEAIAVSASASSEEVQEQVVVDVKPNLNYIWQLVRIQGEILKRPYILVQLFFVILILLAAWRINRPLAQWLKNLLTRYLG